MQPIQKAVFGYGSLVNLKTHSMARAVPATLNGWRRVWVHAAARPVAFLSIEAHPNTIHGRVIDVPDTDWGTLDTREQAYFRTDVNRVTRFEGPTRDVVAYQADPAQTTHPSVGHPILLSYLDVVIAGFLDLMGESGPAHFFETTAGWGPILDDRAAPLYPRAQPLGEQVRICVDDALNALSVPVQPAK